MYFCRRKYLFVRKQIDSCVRAVANVTDHAEGIQIVISFFIFQIINLNKFFIYAKN